MIVVDPKTITTLESAQELVAELQTRLFACEICLEDIARAAEIATMTNQLNLVASFIEAAAEQLKDRLTVVEEETKPMEISIVDYKELQP